MRHVLFVFLLLIATTALASEPFFYQWTDAKGVAQLTNDPETIPEARRHTAVKLNLEEFLSSRDINPALGQPGVPGLMSPIMIEPSSVSAEQ